MFQNLYILYIFSHLFFQRTNYVELRVKNTRFSFMNDVHMPNFKNVIISKWMKRHTIKIYFLLFANVSVEYECSDYDTCMRTVKE